MSRTRAVLMTILTAIAVSPLAGAQTVSGTRSVTRSTTGTISNSKTSSKSLTMTRSVTASSSATRTTSISISPTKSFSSSITPTSSPTQSITVSPSSNCDVACADMHCTVFGGGPKSCLGQCSAGYIKLSNDGFGCSVAHTMELKITLQSTATCESIAAASLVNTDLGQLFVTLADAFTVKSTALSLVGAVCSSNPGAITASVALDITLAQLSDDTVLRIAPIVPGLPASVSGIQIRSWVTRLAAAEVSGVVGNCHASCRTCAGTGVNQCSSCPSNATLSAEVTGQGMCVPNELVPDDEGAVVSGGSGSSPAVSGGGVAAIVIVLLLVTVGILVAIWKRRQLQEKLQNTPKLHKYIPKRVRRLVLKSSHAESATQLPSLQDDTQVGKETVEPVNPEEGVKSMRRNESSTRHSQDLLLSTESKPLEADSLVVAVDGETAKHGQEKRVRGVRKATGRVRSSANVGSGKRIRQLKQPQTSTDPVCQPELATDAPPEPVATDRNSRPSREFPQPDGSSVGTSESRGTSSESDEAVKRPRQQFEERNPSKLLAPPTESQEQLLLEQVRSILDRQLAAKSPPKVLVSSDKGGGIVVKRRQFVRAEPSRTSTLGTNDSETGQAGSVPQPRSILRKHEPAQQRNELISTVPTPSQAPATTAPRTRSRPAKTPR